MIQSYIVMLDADCMWISFRPTLILQLRLWEHRRVVRFTRKILFLYYLISDPDVATAIDYSDWGCFNARLKHGKEVFSHSCWMVHLALATMRHKVTYCTGPWCSSVGKADGKKDVSSSTWYLMASLSLLRDIRIQK